jgi:hypothetical protein
MATSLGADQLSVWRTRSLAPLTLLGLRACGYAFNKERVQRLALSSSYSVLLALTLLYVRVSRDGDTVRKLPSSSQTFRDYDLAAVRTLASSTFFAAAAAWALYVAGVSTTLVLLQALLLPLNVFTSELARLHLWGESEASSSALQRPFADEQAKLKSLFEELTRLPSGKR